MGVECCVDQNLAGSYTLESSRKLGLTCPSPAVSYLRAIYGSTCVATCIGMYNIALLYSTIPLMFV